MCIITHLVIQSTKMMPVLQSRSRLILREALRLDAAMILLVIAQLVAFVEFNHSTFKLADRTGQNTQRVVMFTSLIRK